MSEQDAQTAWLDDGDVKLYHGDVLETLRAMPGASVQTCVTSPPYWGLRDYGDDRQIGLEETLDEFMAKMVAVFAEVRRVLRDDGTLWLNMGDSYVQNGGVSFGGSFASERPGWNGGLRKREPVEWLKAKDLVGQPWMLAFALRSDGWWLRRDIAWHKPNAMPESAEDRPHGAHEYVFLLTKSARYYYDDLAVRQPLQPKTLTTFGTYTKPTNGGSMVKSANWSGDVRERKPKVDESGEPIGAALRSVWSIPTVNYPGAHFATFPPKLVEPCILAGSRPGDVVLDPFTGSGTTAWVARHHGRRAVGIELNEEYLELAATRLAQQSLLTGETA